MSSGGDEHGRAEREQPSRGPPVILSREDGEGPRAENKGVLRYAQDDGMA